MAVGRRNYGLLGEPDAPMYGRRNTIGRVSGAELPPRATTVPGGGGPDPVDPRASQRYTAQQLAGLPLGPEVYQALSRQLGGFVDPRGMADSIEWAAPEDRMEGESSTILGPNAKPRADIMSKLGDYTYEWTPSGGYGASGSLSAYKDGQLAGQFGQKDQSSAKSLGQLAMLAGGAFGGLGLAGAGPLGGLLGPSSAAGGVAGGGEAAFGALEGMGAAGGAEAGAAVGGLGGGGNAAFGALEGMGALGAELPSVALDAAMIPSMPAIQGGAELGTTGLNAMRAGEIASYGGAATVPKAVDIGAGAMQTSPGLLGSLGSVGSAIGDAAQWMKDNPLLGKLLMSGGGALLSGMGGGQSGGQAPMPTGPAKQWSSGLQQGIMAPPVQSQYGLIGPVQGQGAARWLRGGG